MATSPAPMPPKNPPPDPPDPHATRVVVWDVPDSVERGERFRIQVGVACLDGCAPDGWRLAVHDHDGTARATVPVGNAPWPGTDTLYYTEVDLNAPDAEGSFSWNAAMLGGGGEVPHSESRAHFGIRVVPAPDCRITVEAVDAERQTPVPGARVVIHPYRAVTDEHGRADVHVPKGVYRLFVSGRNYAPFRWDGEMTADTTIRAALARDRGISDAEIWS